MGSNSELNITQECSLYHYSISFTVIVIHLEGAIIAMSRIITDDTTLSHDQCSITELLRAAQLHDLKALVKTLLVLQFFLHFLTMS